MTQTQPQELDQESKKQQSSPESDGKQTNKQEPQTKKQQKRHIPKPVVILGAIALLAGIGYGVYRIFFYHPEPGLFLSGRIEGHETDVSAKIGGRIANVAVREGDVVKPGQLLVQIDDADQLAQVQGSQAKVRSSEESLKRYHQQLPVLDAELAQANLTTQQAQQDSQGRVKQAEKSLSASRAQLVQAEASLKLAQVRQRRYRELSAQGAVSFDTRDEYDTSARTAQATVDADRQQVQSG